MNTRDIYEIDGDALIAEMAAQDATEYQPNVCSECKMSLPFHSGLCSEVARG